MFSGVVTEAVLAEVAHRPHPAAVVAVAAEAAATVIDVDWLTSKKFKLN